MPDPERLTQWRDNQSLVLSELKRLSDICEKLDSKVDALSIEFAGTKVRISLFGAIAGGVGGTLLSILTTIIIKLLYPQ